MSDLATEMDLDEASETVDASRSAYGRRGGRGGDGCPSCHYCDVPLGGSRHEHDHAPVPKGEGGVEVVPACLTCHEFKDRARSWGLPQAEYAEAIRGLLRRDLLQGAALGEPPREWPDEWPTLTRWERIVWAIVARTAHQAASPDYPCPLGAATVRRLHEGNRP